MTISFRCPGCGGLCAFKDKNAGKGARCLKCSEKFIIPSESGQKAEKIKPPPGEPVAGFYHAVFVDTWKIFLNRANTTALVFVIAVVTLKFFIGDVDYSFVMPGFAVVLPIGWIVMIISWGCLFWYYMEIIRCTAFDIDDLPEVAIGFGFEFLWNILKSVYLFIVALVLSELPWIILINALEETRFGRRAYLHLLMVGGLFVFPMVILTLSTGRQLWMVFRPDYIVRPIIKAFRPYLVVTGLVILVWILEWESIGYGQLKARSNAVIAIHLVANIGAAVSTIIAMRAVGLFRRHYSCYMP